MLAEATMSEKNYVNWDKIPVALTIDECAELLRIHRNTVLRMLERGTLTGWKAGRAWRISRDLIKNLLEGDE